MEIALIIPGSSGNVTISGPTGLKAEFTNLSSLITNFLPYLFSISGIILFAYLVWGGFNYLTSMGDPKKAEAGKGRITNAIIGFIIIFAAYWMVQIADVIFKLGVYNP